MRNEMRMAYLDILRLVDGYGLCNFCKFAEWQGWSCCEMDLDCKHPLSDRFGFPEPSDVWGNGSDCWAFRPDTTLSKVAEYVSIWMQGYMSRKNKQGDIVAIIPSDADKQAMMGL